MTVHDVEPEVLLARRAFPKAQELLGGAPAGATFAGVEVSWHDTSVSPETGCVAYVRADGPVADLVGEIVRVTTEEDRVLFVYVFGVADVAADLSVSRRSFLHLARLNMETLTTEVSVL